MHCIQLSKLRVLQVFLNVFMYKENSCKLFKIVDCTADLQYTFVRFHIIYMPFKIQMQNQFSQFCLPYKLNQLSYFLFYCGLSKGFQDIDLREFKKSEANVTGFQLVNNKDPSVLRIVEQWQAFDNKDPKNVKKIFKVRTMNTPIMLLIRFPN